MSAQLLRRAVEHLRDPYLCNFPREVAGAIADWIEGHAGDLERTGGNIYACESPGDISHAINVARTFLRDRT